MGLKGLVHRAAVHSLVKIDLKAVKVGAVHAGKLGLAADRQAAAAAHAGAIDHDGVHRHNGLDIVGLGRLDDEFHHDQRSDGDDLVKVRTLNDLLFQRRGDNALLAVGAVIGHNDKLITAGAELVLENDKILVAEADNAGDLGALLVQCLRHGQRNGAAHAAADHADVFQAFDLGGLAQRADEVVHGLALFERVELHRTGAHDLEDDRHGAGLAVKACDGQGDSLGILLRADDDELAGLRLFGDERRMDPELGYGGVQLPPFDDSKQSDLSFSLLFYKVGAYIVAYFPGNVKKKVKRNKQEKTGKRDMAEGLRQGL